MGEGQVYHGEVFDNAYKIHSNYPERFYVYTGLDLRGRDIPIGICTRKSSTELA